MMYWNHTTRGGQSRQTHRRFARRQDAVSSPLCPCSIAATLPAAKGTSTNSGAHPSRSPIEGQDGREAKTGVREHPGHMGERSKESRGGGTHRRTSSSDPGPSRGLPPRAGPWQCGRRPGSVGPLHRYCVFLQVEGLWQPGTEQGHRLPRSG